MLFVEKFIGACILEKPRKTKRTIFRKKWPVSNATKILISLLQFQTAKLFLKLLKGTMKRFVNVLRTIRDI